MKTGKIIIGFILIIIIFSALSLSPLIMASLSREGHRHSQDENINKQFVCSMEPWIIHDQPGPCPICGMALIEKKDFEENYADSTLDFVVRPVNESVLASTRTIKATREQMPLVIEASGVINYDRREIRTVSAHFSGLIERSYVKYFFQPVRKGQKLYEIYCPEIYKDNYNYILLIRKYPDQPQMTVDARNWLTQIGFTEEQIRQLAASRDLDYHLTVYSDAEGYVVDVDFEPDQIFESEESENIDAGLSTISDNNFGLKEGVVVEAGSPLFKVVDTRTVRADLRIRNEDASYLTEGQHIIISDIIDHEWKVEATISQIEPLSGGLFQRVQAYIPNEDNQLFPGMKIHGQIETGSKSSLWLLKSAVTELGLHDAVFLLQDSVFVATAVTTGSRLGNMIEILSGIDENSVIAANASLLTDSDGLINASKR